MLHWYMIPDKLVWIKELQIYVANVNNMKAHFIMLGRHVNKPKNRSTFIDDWKPMEFLHKNEKNEQDL